MTNRKQGSEKSKTFLDYLFFNPRSASSFEAMRLVLQSRRLCRNIDRQLREIMTPEQYDAYINYGRPERKPNWLDRILGRNT